MKEITQKRNALRAFLLTAPREIGLIAKEEFEMNFRRQGYINNGGVLVPWKPRKKEGRARSGATGKRRLTRKAPEGRAILVKSGALRRDIRVQSVTSDTVTLSNSKPYAERHNAGLKGMPRRAFMVEGKVLKERITKMIEKEITKIFK